MAHTRDEAAAVEDAHVTVGRVPKNQRLTWTLRPHDGAVLQAKTVGKSLSGISDMLVAMGKEDGGVFVTLIGVKMDADFAVSFELAILPKDINAPARDGGTK